jgi:hypothetical protein
MFMKSKLITGIIDKIIVIMVIIITVISVLINKKLSLILKNW